MRTWARDRILRLWMLPVLVRWAVICAIVVVMLWTLGWAPVSTNTDRHWFLWGVSSSTNHRPWSGVRERGVWRFAERGQVGFEEYASRHADGDIDAALIYVRPSSIYVGLVVAMVELEPRIAAARAPWSVWVLPDGSPRTEADDREALKGYAAARYGDATLARHLPEGGDYQFRWLPEGVVINAIWIIGGALLGAIAYVRYKHAHVIYHQRIRNMPVPERTCTRCGYCLDGLKSGPCPECGWTIC